MRLKSISKDFGELPFDAIPVLINPVALQQEVENAQGGSASRILSVMRNILALAPLIVTWLSIATAVTSYQQYLQTHPSARSEPFLELWQTGFGGGTWLTLSNTAIIDALLLVILLVLTVVAHILDGRAQEKSGEVYDELQDFIERLKHRDPPCAVL